MSDKKSTISFCAIVKNESEYIAGMLDSIINVADEIIIVDTGSTDDTVAIIESYGIKVYHYQWENDFAKARNFSLSKATKDWIFYIDADERLIVEGDFYDQLNIKDHVYMVSKKDIHYDTFAYTSSTRLFPNFQNFKYYSTIHEYIDRKEIFTKSMFKSFSLLHFGYKNQEILKIKASRNIEILKSEILKYDETQDTYYHLLLLFGKEYAILGDYYKAIELHIKYINSEFAANNLNLVNAITDLIKLFYNLNRFDEMIFNLEKYKDLASVNPDFCIYYADYLGNIQNDYQKSIFYYQKTLYFKPFNNPGVSYSEYSLGFYPNLMIGINYLKLKKFQQSVSYLTKAFNQSQNPKALYYLIISSYNIDKSKANDLFETNINLLDENQIKSLKSSF